MSEAEDRRTHWTIEALKEHVEAMLSEHRRAVALAHEDLSRRLEGFPQQFATKAEQDAAREALQRLDRESVSRELYDTRHRAMADLVTRLDRDKLPAGVFQTFVDNQRQKDDEAATERRAVASVLATATAREGGQQATWKQIGAVLTGIVAFLTIVVVAANYFFQPSGSAPVQIITVTTKTP